MLRGHSAFHRHCQVPIVASFQKLPSEGQQPSFCLPVSHYYTPLKVWEKQFARYNPNGTQRNILINGHVWSWVTLDTLIRGNKYENQLYFDMNWLCTSLFRLGKVTVLSGREKADDTVWIYNGFNIEFGAEMILEELEEQKSRKLPPKFIETTADGEWIQQPRFQPKTLKQIVHKSLSQFFYSSQKTKRKRKIKKTEKKTERFSLAVSICKTEVASRLSWSSCWESHSTHIWLQLLPESFGFRFFSIF